MKSFVWGFSIEEQNDPAHQFTRRIYYLNRMYPKKKLRFNFLTDNPKSQFKTLYEGSSVVVLF